jgi:hypothetical protein
MNLTNNDLNILRESFAVCRLLGVDAVVVTEGKIRGISQDSKAAILTDAQFSFDSSIKIGIGRIPELEKRLNIFSTAAVADAKVNDNNDVVMLKIKGGKAAVEFRCTAPKLIRYPKENADTASCTIKLTKDEVQQIVRGIRSMAAETSTVAVTRAGVVKVECASPTNEAFEIELDAAADFENDQQGIVHIYSAPRLANILDAAIKSYDEVALQIGEYGSITSVINGYQLVMNAEADHEGDDDE